MKRTIIAAALSLISFTASAETLKGDAILCETPEPLALLAQPHLANLPGSTVMERVTGSVKFWKLDAQIHGELRDLASKEDLIMAEHGSSRGWAQRANRRDEANNQIQQGQAKGAPYSDFVTHCKATSASSQTVAVIERRPISGLVLVKAKLDAQNEYSLWTHDSYLLSGSTASSGVQSELAPTVAPVTQRAPIKCEHYTIGKDGKLTGKC
jgi:hypothetical protein